MIDDIFDYEDDNPPVDFHENNELLFVSENIETDSLSNLVDNDLDVTFNINHDIIDLVEEMRLRELYVATGNPKARDKIILSVHKMIWKMAHKMRYYGIPQEDLISAGYVGAVEAFNSFDFTTKTRFITYAYSRVKLHLLGFVESNFFSSRVLTTAGKRKLFWNIRKILNGKELTVDLINEIAEKLDVDREDVVFIYSAFKGEQHTFPVFSYLSTSEDVKLSEETTEIIINDGMFSHEDNVFDNIQFDQSKANIMDSVSFLNENERFVIIGRYFDEKTLKDLSGDLGVSLQRVSNIEHSALNKLSKILGDTDISSLF